MSPNHLGIGIGLMLDAMSYHQLSLVSLMPLSASGAVINPGSWTRGLDNVKLAVICSFN